jgi:hypothetical protein
MYLQVVRELELGMVPHKVCLPLILGGKKTFRFLALCKYFLEATDQTKPSNFKPSFSFDRQDRILTSLYDFLVVTQLFLFYTSFLFIFHSKTSHSFTTRLRCCTLFLNTISLLHFREVQITLIKMLSFVTDAR